MQSLDAIKGDLHLSHVPLLPDFDALRKDLTAHKVAAVAAGDEETAKLVWCLQETIESQTLFIRVYKELRSGEYYKSWCSCEQVELALGRLRPHFKDQWAKYRLEQIDAMTIDLQSLYPYKIFMSPEFLMDEKSCSICGKLISPRNPCGHKVGEIYKGEYCYRVVNKFRVMGTAFVEHPVQKYSVPFRCDPATGESIDHYNYATVEYIAKRWPNPFARWKAEWTKRLYPKEPFGYIRRNDKCPCDSGKKYKRCCMDSPGIMRPHVQFSFDYAVPAELITLEYTK